MIVQFTQKWLVARPDTSDATNAANCKKNGCVGWIKGIPPSLSAIAAEEGWTLPHYWTEVGEKEVPDDGA